ncbi:hypothetical protein EDC01DRAFT_641516 [Geopyxis carbonaria]|nr:hypothetical protein EDC01DRAFT_641516 [Geopyxis carbonaria]
MVPPLDRSDLYWKGRSSSSYFRFPRRTRRTTCALLAVITFIVYQLFKTSTSTAQWQVPSYFESSERQVAIRFPKLYRTLAAVPGTRRRNRNVVFAAANLTAASKMSGIACEMSKFGRSNVHIAMMGFDGLELDEFKIINGIPLDIDDPDCSIYFHDARPEFAEELPLARRKIAVKSAFRHIGNMMHPQAIIIDPAREDDWFIDIATEKAQQMDLTIIKLPANAIDDTQWITRLDSGSLKAWHKPTFEVVIHADAHSGNLERLLKSLAGARYPSKEHHPTQITIILDSSIKLHPFTKSFLQGYRFPAHSRVTIRRPITPKIKPEDAAIQFVESFYSVDDDHSVLVLDPNTELSTWYFHYLFYTILEYRYSSYQSHEAEGLYGISLEHPPTDLTGQGSLPIPSSKKSSFFLYQAPSSRAALYFSQPWAEFHTYYSHRLLPSRHVPPKSINKTNIPRELRLSKEIATSWQAPLIELARARGYVMLYPSLAETLAIVHNEVPSYTRKPHGHEKKLLQQGFPGALLGSDLPVWSSLPMLNLWAERVDSEGYEMEAIKYRSSISTCPPDMFDKQTGFLVLFCDKNGNAE